MSSRFFGAARADAILDALYGDHAVQGLSDTVAASRPSEPNQTARPSRRAATLSGTADHTCQRQRGHDGIHYPGPPGAELATRDPHDRSSDPDLGQHWIETTSHRDRNATNWLVKRGVEILKTGEEPRVRCRVEVGNDQPAGRRLQLEALVRDQRARTRPGIVSDVALLAVHGSRRAAPRWSVRRPPRDLGEPRPGSTERRR